MGGVLVWGTAIGLAALFWFFDRVIGIDYFRELNFLTRKETLLPLGALLGASVVGLVDDFLNLKQLGHKGHGFRFSFKVWLYAAVALIGALWFYYKLGFDFISVPLLGTFHIGWWFVPFFILAVIGISFSVNLTDGLDGLAGGVLLICFFSLAIIAFWQGKNDLTSLLGVICGGLLAFLWFNVYPARFFMGDTGSMGLGVFLAIVAFLTNSVFLLPFLGFIFFLESVSFFAQVGSKKILKRKLLLSAPIHHHLEAIGWPETKITMRFWIISAVTGIFGVIVYFLSK
jgi:phospho-N-acetylmuramoyl-pentapeptide-transferase